MLLEYIKIIIKNYLKICLPSNFFEIKKKIEEINTDIFVFVNSPTSFLFFLPVWQIQIHEKKRKK